MADGWIKLWRKIEDNPVLQDAVRYSLFVRLLARAAHHPAKVWFKGRWFDIRRGDVLMSERDMAKLLNCDRQRIRTALRVLKNAEMLTHSLTHGLTQVSICHYSHYQDGLNGANPETNPPTNPVLTQGKPTEQEGEEGEEGKNKRGEASQRLNGVAAPPTNRGTRLPKDWEPDATYRAAALKVGLPRNMGAPTAAKFRDHFVSQPGQRGVKVDWLATWRNWCREEVRRMGLCGTTVPPHRDPFIL